MIFKDFVESFIFLYTEMAVVFIHINLLTFLILNFFVCLVSVYLEKYVFQEILTHMYVCMHVYIGNGL